MVIFYSPCSSDLSLFVMDQNASTKSKFTVCFAGCVNCMKKSFSITKAILLILLQAILSVFNLT